MTVTTLREHGDSYTLTLPEELNLTAGSQYVVFEEGDGTLILSPRVPFKFADSAPGSEYEGEDPISFFESEIGE
ncbi:AbrB/MazE/SpoVT family DNA-binding domain-containing protein [Fructobacillus sp. W13]|uniref:AbrB/MazE/SpoVT family DNA-binding domain-containing protein n=1 Tax=Fructobacillus apis TaxID=2935017 RepID=A0ABT0ZNG7_9LACO|nr:AbrB/MazE/SpoVT family DNA-binding domain-containing protein [Fructobacillus apis]MCO0831523.1 AbrB/MazE/SpoVT family DNA-binding domain-containing protein [Fructobacillus apis]